MAAILFLSHDVSFARRACCELRAQGHRVYAVSNPERVKQIASRVDVVLLDAARNGGDPLNDAGLGDQPKAPLPVIVIRANGFAQTAMSSGAKLILAGGEDDAISLVAAHVHRLSPASAVDHRQAGSPDTRFDAWHRHVLEGDPDVIEAFCRLAMPVLARRIRRRLFDADARDPTRCESAAGYAVARYATQPGRYDPLRGPLLPWLEQIGVNDAISDARCHNRHIEHEVPLNDPDPGLMVAPAFFDQHWHGALRVILRACWAPEERAFMRARLRGFGPTAETLALGFADAPPKVQARERYKALKRIKKRIRGALARDRELGGSRPHHRGTRTRRRGVNSKRRRV